MHDSDCVPRRRTCLHWAAFNGHLDIVDLLLLISLVWCPATLDTMEPAPMSSGRGRSDAYSPCYLHSAAPLQCCRLANLHL